MMQTHVSTLLLGLACSLLTVLTLLSYYYYAINVSPRMLRVQLDPIDDSKFLPNVRINRRAVMMRMLVWFLKQANIRNEDQVDSKHLEHDVAGPRNELSNST